jgi:hypothetical protein
MNKMYRRIYLEQDGEIVEMTELSYPEGKSPKPLISFVFLVEIK